MSPQACEQLKVKDSAVDELIMHDHDVLEQFGMLGSPVWQPINVMKIDNPLGRLDLLVDQEPSQMEWKSY